MVKKADILKSLKRQGLVDEPDILESPEYLGKFAAMIACVVKKVIKGEPIDSAVKSCYLEILLKLK